MITEILKAVILGIVEGITEFLPISSTGHLILVNQWFYFSPAFTPMFDIVIQLGAILAVVVIFWQKIWPFNKSGIHKKEVLNVWYKTLIGVIPAIIIGGLLGSLIEAKLFNPEVVALALIIGGIVLIVIERQKTKPRFKTIIELPWHLALGIGLFQCISMIPGSSRAAATIIGALVLGATRELAVEFSFFLAIPTMIAASGYALLKHGISMNNLEFTLIAIGFVTSFLVALAVIKLFLGYIKQHNLIIFGYYRLALGLLILGYFLANAH